MEAARSGGSSSCVSNRACSAHFDGKSYAPGMCVGRTDQGRAIGVFCAFTCCNADLRCWCVWPFGTLPRKESSPTSVCKAAECLGASAKYMWCLLPPMMGVGAKPSRRNIRTPLRMVASQHMFSWSLTTACRRGPPCGLSGAPSNSELERTPDGRQHMAGTPDAGTLPM